MEREFGDVGRFVLEKQCRDIDIEPDSIEAKDVPRLSRILSGLVSRFGNDRSKRVLIEINNLITEESGEESEEEDDDEDVPSLFGSRKITDKMKSGIEIRDISEK